MRFFPGNNLIFFIRYGTVGGCDSGFFELLRKLLGGRLTSQKCQRILMLLSALELRKRQQQLKNLS